MIIEYITLGVYFVFLLIIGGIFSKYIKNLSDFVKGGSRITWWMAGTSMTMAAISAFTFSGNGSAAYNSGPTFLFIYVANVLAYMVGGLFLARWYRQTRAYTGLDVLRARYGTAVEQITLYFGILTAPFGAGIQLWALSLFVSGVFGFPVHFTIILIGFIVVTYSVSGGAYAVMATDVVQGIILFAVTFLVFILAFVEIGGVGGFLMHWNDPQYGNTFDWIKEPGAYADNKFTWKWIVVICFLQFANQINLSAAPRFLSLKDGKEASKASYLAMVLMLVGSCIWFLPAFVARFLYVDQVEATGLSDPGTAAYAIAAKNLLPNGMMGIMIAAMFSATMSSMDSGINGTASMIVRNCIGRIREFRGLDPLPDEKHVFYCRGIAFLFGLLIITSALLLASQDRFILFDAYFVLGSVLGLPLAVPALAGLLLRRLPSWSYYVMVAAGFIPSIWSLLDEKFFGNPWGYLDRSIWVFGSGCIAALITVPFARFTSEKFKKMEREFFTKMFTPVDFEKEIGGANDASQAAIMGKIIIAIGILMHLLLFIPNDLVGRLIIFVISLVIIGVGAIFSISAKRIGTKALDKMEAQKDEL